MELVRIRKSTPDNVKIETGDTFIHYFLSTLTFCISRGSSGSIVSDYGLDDRGLIPDKGRGFFF
jgi:hypothetical protein